MKNLKILIILLFLSISLNASMLLDSQYRCIESFYIKNGSFYYLRSDNNTWYSTTTKNYTNSVKPNFIYDVSTQQCNPNLSYILGMQETEYNFLLGIVGLIFGAVFMFFVVQNFIYVGGRK